MLCPHYNASSFYISLFQPKKYKDKHNAASKKQQKSAKKAKKLLDDTDDETSVSDASFLFATDDENGDVEASKDKPNGLDKPPSKQGSGSTPVNGNNLLSAEEEDREEQDYERYINRHVSSDDED